VVNTQGPADPLSDQEVVLAPYVDHYFDVLDRARAILTAVPHPDPDLYPHVLNTLAVVSALAGEVERASAACEEVLLITEPHGDGIHRTLALWTNGLDPGLTALVRGKPVGLRVARCLDHARHQRVVVADLGSCEAGDVVCRITTVGSESGEGMRQVLLQGQCEIADLVLDH
jgi:hypothetical protein